MIILTVAGIALFGIALGVSITPRRWNWGTPTAGMWHGPRLVGTVFCCVCLSVTVWYYRHQIEVKIRRVSLWSLLMLVLAIAVGLQIGLLLVAPSIQ